MLAWSVEVDLLGCEAAQALASVYLNVTKVGDIEDKLTHSFVGGVGLALIDVYSIVVELDF